MPIHSIRFKLPCTILSITIVALVLLTLTSGGMSKVLMETQIGYAMESTAANNVIAIEEKLTEITSITKDIAAVVAATYTDVAPVHYEELLKKIVFNSAYISGSGIWFEPYVYDENTKYNGIYAVKEETTAYITYEYSNEAYDYFSYDWYKGALNMQVPTFTQPYYDAALDASISTCRMPILVDGKCIGVITADMQLGMVDEIISSIAINNMHNAFAVDQTGQVVSKGEAFDVAQDTNTSFRTLLENMSLNGSGTATYNIGKENMHVYYAPIEELQWILGIQIPERTLLKPVTRLIRILILMTVLSIIVASMIIFWQLRRIVNRIYTLNSFALEIADNNLTVPLPHITTHDELGQLGTSLCKILAATEANVIAVKSNATAILTSSTAQKETTDSTLNYFKNIAVNSQEISQDMMSASAATEELNASIEEVSASIHQLSAVSGKNTDVILGIHKKAQETRGHTQQAVDQSISLVNNYEQLVSQGMEEIKVVQAIGTMADDIANIADKINLLALNASIEAARAGAQGYGFAVVATEIGHLAKSTTDTVGEVQGNIEKVQHAVNGLTTSTMQLLTFIKDTVTPDYAYFLDVSQTYETDAEEMEKSALIAVQMTENIERTITSITEVIQNITEVVQNSAMQNDQTATQIQQLVVSVEELTKLTAAQTEIATTLAKFVSTVKVKDN